MGAMLEFELPIPPTLLSRVWILDHDASYVPKGQEIQRMKRENEGQLV